MVNTSNGERPQRNMGTLGSEAKLRAEHHEYDGSESTNG
jgi:hypothetical protein